MRIHWIIPAIICFAAAPLLAQRDYEPEVRGYITHVASATEIDVNGFHVRMVDKTELYFLTGKTYARTSAQEWKPYLGQPAQVYGKFRDKEHAIIARQVNLLAQQTRKVSGSGIIDAIPPAAPSGPLPEGQLLRADGYLVLATKETAQTFQPPMTDANTFQTNVWVGFHGTQRSDGVVVASDITFRQNIVNEREDKLRKKTEHDPGAVDPEAQQGLIAKNLLGIDPKKLPPYKDDALQARVSAIGDKLVPTYQRNLADTDETKINFRFQVVEEGKLPLAWPNGIILVPHNAVERLQNDAQIAAVLAYSIATVLEKHSFRSPPRVNKLTATILTASAAAIFTSPVLGAEAALNVFTGNTDTDRYWEQSCRVSLFLMHDAGYDVYEAPLAWSTLADQRSKSTRFLVYFYRILGETWRKG
jgi:hypothetical protein